MKKITFLFLSTGSLLAYGENQQRPNILWLTYEDTSPQFIGCYGDKNAKTPNMDKMAEEGIRFTSAFSTGAVSSPSRFCLFTGIRTTTMGTGHHRSRYPMPKNIEGFPYYLRQAGYYTTNNVKTDYNVANAKALTVSAWNEYSNTADWRGRKPGQPFFAIYNSPASHQSKTMTNPWDIYEKQILSQLNDDEKTQGGQLEMPTIYRNSPEMQKHLSRVYNSITVTDKEFGEWIAKLEQDGLRDSTIIFCFADHGEGLPRGKASAVGMGYRVPFIAWFPPMYAHLSPWGKGGIVTDELISFEDLAATMLSLAQVTLPDYLEGRIVCGRDRQKPKKYIYSAVDRIGESTDLCRSINDGKYLYTRVFMNYMPFLDWNMYFDVSEIQKTIRKDFIHHKLNKKQQSILQPRAAEYLYDLENDKWETNNLIGNKKYADKATELRTALRTYLETNRDAHFIPEYYLWNQNKPLMPFQKRQDNEFYPVKDVLDVAYLSGMGEKVIAQQINWLQHKNPIVQYWAAVGLYGQEKGLQKYKQPLEETWQNMDICPAKIYLGATLYKYFNNAEAKQFLLDIAKNTTETNLARNALQTCMYLYNKQKQEILPDIKNMLEQNKNNRKVEELNEFCKMFIYYTDGTGELTYDTWW